METSLIVTGLACGAIGAVLGAVFTVCKAYESGRRAGASGMTAAVIEEIRVREMMIPTKVENACKNKNGMFRKADAKQVCYDTLNGLVLRSTQRYADSEA